MFTDTAQLLAAPPWLLDLLDTSTRVTVLLVAAGITAWLLRRSPAQARHQVWMLALTGALFLPLAALVLPAWHLRILPAPASRQAPARDEPAPAFELTPGFELPRGERPAVLVSTTRSAARSAELTASAGEPLPARRAPLLARVAGDVLAPLAGVGAADALPLSLGTWLLGVWLAGIGLVLGRALLDRVQVWYFSQRARTVRDERAALFGRQLDRLGLARVGLVELDDVDLPMTWGVLRPTVALPAHSRRWSRARLEAVMLHELAHVRRRDALTQLVASLACALYWFHPLTWLAARQMRVLREYACDDEVLGQGVRPSSYAEEIIGIVHALKREERPSTATLAMARRSELGARLLALLDPHIAHARWHRGRAAVLSLSALTLMLSAAVVRPAAAEAPAPLPRLTPGESARRKVKVPAEATQLSQATPAEVSGAQSTSPATVSTPPPVTQAGPMTRAAPTPVAPVAPVAPLTAPAPSRAPLARPVAAAPAAPAAPESCAEPSLAATPAPEAPRAAWSEDGDDDEQELAPPPPPVTARAHSRGRPDDDELERIDQMRRTARDERDLTRSLTKLARDADFETETSRQSYLAACASLTDDGLRLEALLALLKGAPISPDTGRGVLTQAQKFQRDEPRMALLKMMDRIRESALIRGPLANAYLDVVAQLQAHETQAEALRQLLHPHQVQQDAVQRALELLQKVSEPELRKKVLIEVTDHQVITPEVERAYQALTAGFSPGLLKDAQERLAEAGRGHGKGWSFSWSGWNNNDERSASADARRAQADARRAQSDARRAELDKVRAEVQRELASERESLKRRQAELEASARQIKEQARQLGQQYKQKARELQERLKRQFGPEGSGPGTDADTDVEVDVDTGQ
jgi:beta-lactamase regulating signal transducer with metallopeptidase domain/prefoldin subunit 5